MATNLSIDPKLIERALAVSGERTKKAAVTKALQEFIARRRQKRLLDLVGKLVGIAAIFIPLERRFALHRGRRLLHPFPVKVGRGP